MLIERRSHQRGICPRCGEPDKNGDTNYEVVEDGIIMEYYCPECDTKYTEMYCYDHSSYHDTEGPAYPNNPFIMVDDDNGVVLATMLYDGAEYVGQLKKH